MANDAVLSASSRANLLSLQNTQRAIDATQLRLATGKKINSALDGAQNFFTSQALSNRASDLTRLLDGIGQSIQTIVEADKGVSALTKLVEQADAIVSSARDELAASDGQARLVGTTDLRAVVDITAAPFGTNIVAGDIIRVTTTDDAGAQIVENITISGGDSAYTLAAKITDQFADNRAGEITANINATTGALEIQSKGGRSFKVGDTLSTSATTGNVNIGLAGYTALGIGRYFELERRGPNTSQTSAQALIVAGNTAKSISLYESAGNLADAGDVIQGNTYIDANGNTLISAFSGGANSINFIVNASTAIVSGAVTLTSGTTFQDLVDQINLNTAINTYVKAAFDSLTGQLQLTSLRDSVENLNVSFANATSQATTFNLGFGDGIGGNLDDIGTIGGTTTTFSSGTFQQVLAFNSSTQALDGYANDYNTIRSQINDLVKDAEYRGVNLLNGDNLTTFFNEDNTSKLVTSGKRFTADGLGLVLANFSSSQAIETQASLTKTALNTVRTFGSSLSNNLAIIQARQTFTEETINTLKAGAAQLTNADLNEEGANLLALQTAQQLGVTSLSLASQSQQSVLRLF